ncbi:hypothetical protein GAYE_PCTG14G0593 [Galdieria yellowstonensis]|uniref:SWIM-type domain-containing protein n=1 Tax=Galdieria yellowstonensis TaxID=3028027 RepID=A0AAV9I5S0_9RHOD|nr:hypothetical protein GAYE_PCTG14G0593 [Galdieria yellowstonensis]
MVKDIVDKQQLLDEHLLAMNTIMPNTVREVLPLLESMLYSEQLEENMFANQSKEKNCFVVPSIPFCNCKQFCEGLYGRSESGDSVCKHIVLACFAIEQQQVCKVRHLSFEEWTLQVSKLLLQE